MSDSIVLAAPVRTPIGKFNGGLADFDPADLGAIAARACLERAELAPEHVDQAIFGHARQAGGGPNGARQVALRAELAVSAPAYTINQACLSGLQAILGGIRAIRCGEAEVVLAGGMEAMSRIPYLLEARWGFRMGHQEVVDAMYRDGYLDPICGKLMGETAETLVERYGISRDEQDAYAARSQQRAEAAWNDGRFAEEVVPVELPGKSGPVTLSRDEHFREGVTAASLAKLKPVFRQGGSVTAANSSGITDGASALLVLSEAAAQRHGVTPVGRVVDYQVDGVAPEVMGIGPVPAVKKLLERTQLDLNNIDLVELNEAFAAQVIAVDRELGFDPERLNVNGGAIALGHPSGCSGNRIVVTLLHEMVRRQSGLGLATLCVSGGLGGALLLERVG